MLGDAGLANALGGELTRDWYDIYLVNRVGSDTNVTVRYGKNLLGISHDVDDTNAVTRIVPTCDTKDGKPLYLDELYIDSAHVNEYPHPNQFIQRHIGWEFAGVYADEGITGTKDERPRFQQMLADCRAGKINMIVTKSISRFARNTIGDGVVFLKSFVQHYILLDAE